MEVKANTLINGDALTVLRCIPPGNVDALITDPPYSSGGQFRGDRVQDTRNKYLSSGDISAEYAKHSFTGDNLDQRSWTSWAAEWLTLARGIVKPGGVAAVFTDWRQIGALTDAVQWAGWTWRGILVWDKKNARPQPGRPRQQCEFVVWASNGALNVKRNAPYMPGIFSVPPHGRKTPAPNRKAPCAYAETCAYLRNGRRDIRPIYGEWFNHCRRHFGGLRIHRDRKGSALLQRGAKARM